MRIDVYRRITIRGWRWYWTAVHANGNKMADSSEGYNTRAGCLDSLVTVQKELGSAKIYILTDTGGIDQLWEPPQEAVVTDSQTAKTPHPLKPRKKPKNRKRRD